MRNLAPNPGSLHGRMRAQGAGFTLIELSAVILIIGILVGLLCSALNHTKTKALRISCLDNVKQLQTAWLMYTDDNEQFFPLNQSAPGPKDPRFPVERLSTNSWAAGNPRFDIGTRNLEMGTLFPYTRSTALYRCPMDDSKVLNNRAMNRVRSYSISAALGGDDVGLDPRVKLKYDQLIDPRPDSVFVFIEEHPASLWTAGFRVLTKDQLTVRTANLGSTPADRHYQGCHISFADGHVEFWKWYASKGDQPSVRLTSAAQKEWTDLRRLQSCVPKP